MFRLIFILIFLPFLSIGQNSFADDSLLERLSDSLSKGWTMTLSGNELIIFARDSVWERNTNYANGPYVPSDSIPRPVTDEDWHQLFIKEGHKVLSKKVYRLEPRWSSRAIADAEAKDSVVNKQIAKVEKEDNILPHRPEFGYEQSRELHDMKLDKKREELRAKLIRPPKLNSAKYSLYEVSETGFEHWYNAVWPTQASEERDRAIKKINEILGKRAVLQ